MRIARRMTKIIVKRKFISEETRIKILNCFGINLDIYTKQINYKLKCEIFCVNKY